MVKKILALALSALLAVSLASCAAKESDDKTEQKAALVFEAFDCAYSSYDESTVSAYSDLCKAVYNGEADVRVNVGMLEDIIQLFYTSYPLNVLVKDIKVKDDKSGFTIEYNQSADDTKAKAQAFSDRVNEILTACKYGKAPKAAFAINLYSYVAANVKKSDKDKLTVYDKIMTLEGDSYTASNMLEYLLRQGGIASGHVIATDASGAGWGISVAQIGGANYLFDPMTEFLANGGKQLCYFGMTTDDAKAEGLASFLYTNQSSAPVCDNPYFDACRSCTEWELSRDNKSLFVTRADEQVIQIDL